MIVDEVIDQVFNQILCLPKEAFAKQTYLKEYLDLLRYINK